MTINEKTSGSAQSAYFAYQEVLVALERHWADDDIAFGSAECERMSKELARRAVELNAQARDWANRAAETAEKEKTT